MISPELIIKIKSQIQINWSGAHGIMHWARVYNIGMKLAQRTGANQNVVRLFSIFHDSGRYNEHSDPKHGSRGAKLATQLRATYCPELADKEFELLHLACCLHTQAPTHEDITVQTCFDADRLDLGRVGKVPNPGLLCTDAAKSEKMIGWAYQKSVEKYIPDNVLGRFIIQGG
jgi:uncharacterized protein